MSKNRSLVNPAHRRLVGKGFSVASVSLSVIGLIVLAVLWGWDPLVRTDAVYFGVLGVGFGLLTWILVAADADNGAVWAIAWSALFSSLFTAGLASAVVLSRRTFPGLTLDELRELSPAELPASAAFALHFRFWAVVPALWLALTFGLLLFPDGRLPSPRWKWVGWLSMVAIATATLATAFVHNPRSTLPVKAAEDTVDSFGGALIDIAFQASSIAALLSALSLVARYRHSSGAIRGQIRWIGFGGTFFILFLLFGGNVDLWGGRLVHEVFGIGAFTVLIACWGVAITKHRLYDINVVISKSVTYLGLGAVITVLYIVVVAGPALVIGSSSEASDDRGVGIYLFLATGLVALVIEPVRSRMQRWANRMVYGQRSSPHEVLSQLTARLSEPGADDGVANLARLLAEGTGAEQAVVWLRRDGTFDPEGVWPLNESSRLLQVPASPIGDEHTVVTEVRQRDELLGAVSIHKSRNDPATRADRELVADVASSAGLMLRNIGLNRQLEQRARQVRESRLRLIAAQDAERHRLERDLHDGAQQQVVALKVKLGVAKTLAERAGLDEIATLVSGLAADTQHAVDALRSVAHGIYPPLLEAEGLEVALRAVERTSPEPMSIVMTRLARYERHVEQTAYFCVLETVERIRMSGARDIRVELVHHDDELVITIENDGRVTESDLISVSDRVDAHGGTTAIELLDDGLTRITSRLPEVVVAMEPA